MLNKIKGRPSGSLKNKYSARFQNLQQIPTLTRKFQFSALNFQFKNQCSIKYSSSFKSPSPVLAVASTPFDFASYLRMVVMICIVCVAV